MVKKNGRGQWYDEGDRDPKEIRKSALIWDIDMSDIDANGSSRLELID